MGDNFEKLRFVFENDALRLKMREHFVLRIIDRIENVEAAQRFGMQAICFEDAAQYERELRKFLAEERTK